MQLTKTSVFGEIVALAAMQIKMAAAEGVQSTITTNKAGRKFFNLFGNTFPLKDQLGRKGLGFVFFQGAWGMPVEKAMEMEAQIQALGIDTSVLHSEMATAPSAPAAPAQAPAATPAQQGPQTATQKTLAEMKADIEAEMEKPSTDPRAIRMLNHIDKMIDKIANSVDEAAKTEFIKNFLAFASKFHEYSFGNQMLIWIQRPDASYVAGHAQWLKKGRQVVNWGRPISIVRPQANRRTLSDEELVQKNLTPDKREQSWMSFKPAVVYDISDTKPIEGWKGKDGQGPFEPKSWRSDSNDDVEEIKLLVSSAAKFATSLGITVDLEKEMREEMGGYSAGKEIAVNKDYRGINQFSTIVHEMAHEILHREGDGSKTMTRDSRQAKEIDAETAAYIVLQHYGFETKDTPNYIALWRGTGKDVRDRRNHIAKAVKIIINGIDSTAGTVIESGFQEAVPEEAAPATPGLGEFPAAWVRQNCRFAQTEMTEESISFDSQMPEDTMVQQEMTGDLQMDQSMQGMEQSFQSMQMSIESMPEQIKPEMENLYNQFYQQAMQIMKQTMAGPGPYSTSSAKP